MGSRRGERPDDGAPLDRRAEHLTGRTFAASGWQLGALLVQAVLQLAILAVLSRLVTPAEFGTLGVAMIFVGFLNLFTELGVGPALVQRDVLTPRHVGTGFTLALVGGAVLTAAIWVAAPFWASVFQNAQVEPTLRLLSLGFLAASLGIVSGALLQRDLAFRSLALADVLSYAIGYGGVGIVLASRGFGTAALAWAVVVQSGVRSTWLLLAAGRGVRPAFHLREAKAIAAYGFGLGLSEVFNYAATRGDYVVVGRWLGAAMLGLYERAYKLIELPAHYVAGALDRVLFPAMSAIQRDLPRLRRVYLNSVGLMALIYLPLSVVLGLLARPGIEVLFGSDWLGAVAPLQVLSAGLLFRASYKISDSLIRALGAIYRSAWRVLAYAVLVIAGALVGQRWGIVGVAAAIVLAITAKYLLVSHLSLSLLGVSWRAFARAHRAGALTAVVLAGVLWTTGEVLGPLELQPWAELLVQLATTAGTMAILFRTAPPSWLGPELFWALGLLRREAPVLGGVIRAIFGERTLSRAVEPDTPTSAEAPTASPPHHVPR